MTKQEYDTELDRYTAAWKIFYAAIKAFRAREIGDDEYLNARFSFQVAQDSLTDAETALLSD